MANRNWKFPSLPGVLQRQIELAPVLSALRSGQPLTQEQRDIVIALIEKQLTPAAMKQADEAEQNMWRDWRLAMLDVLAGDHDSRRKNIAKAFPADAEITDVTVKNAHARFKQQATEYRDILSGNGGKEALQAAGAEIVESLVYDFDADEQKLLQVILPY